MPKRPHVDDASQDLIDSLRDDDDLAHALNAFEDERVTIGVACADIEEKLQREFGSDRLSTRNQLRLDQKLEYEHGLRDDRLRKLDRKIERHKQEHHESGLERKKRRVGERKVQELDDNILECQTLAQKHCQDCDWKTIGKNKHIQQMLNNKLSTMSEEQKALYDSVLTELKEKGWRVLNRKEII